MKNLVKFTLITALVFTACTGNTTSTGLDDDNETDNSNVEQGTTMPEITDADWSKGNLESTIILVEYSDLQCPACKSREPLVEKLIQEFGNHIRFVYRHMPLSSMHKNAQKAAEATEAAGMQDKFWEMHDLLFEKQKDWSDLSNTDFIETLATYAEEIGLDLEQFNSDLESSEVEDAVDEDKEGAIDAGVNSTPTFFLNGSKINPKTYEEYRELIRQAIEA